MKIKKVFKVSWFERWTVIDAMEKLGYRILSRKSRKGLYNFTFVR